MVIGLESGCVLFETKAGPFDTNQPKDLDSWAPDEGPAGALAYLNMLVGLVEINPNGYASDAGSPLDPKARSPCPTGF